MILKSSVSGLLGALALVLIQSQAVHASGLALRETGAAGQGGAFAGATAGAAEDVSSMAHNPATLTLHPGEHAAATVTAIAPKAEFTKSAATLAAAVGGGNISGGNGGADIAPDALVPAIYYARQLAPDWFAGVSLTAPFGLKTDYDADWAGRYHAIKSDLRTLNVNPVLAYRVSPRLSVGGGLQLAYSRGIMSNAVDFGTINALLALGVPGAVPGASDGTVKVDGDDLALGYNFGLLYEIRPGTRIGAAYRSKLHNRLYGEAEFHNGAIGSLISGATGGGFVNGGMHAEVNLPETASFGIRHEITPRLAVMAEAEWTAWSRLRELRVRYDNPAQADAVIVSWWRDTMFYAVGAAYKPGDGWVLRAGLAFDGGAVPDDTRTPRVPDADRGWVSVGARYQVASASFFDIGYSHIVFKDAVVGLTTAGDANNVVRGNLRGGFKASVDVLAAQYRLAF